MDENEFAADEATGWLREPEADSSIIDARVKVASYNEWDEEWYADEGKLRQFYQGFQDNSGLVSELAELQDKDYSERATWLLDAIDAQHQEPTYDDNYNLWYRYNNITGEYWWHEGAEGKAPESRSMEWFNQSVADQLVQEAQAGGEEVAEGPAEQAPEATWDENWNMFYRLTGDGAYQYAFSDTGNGSGQPRDTWYDYQDVPDSDPEAVAAAVEPEAAPEAEDVTEAQEAAEGEGETATELPQPIEISMESVVESLDVPQAFVDEVAGFSDETIRRAFAEALAEKNA